MQGLYRGRMDIQIKCGAYHQREEEMDTRIPTKVNIHSSGQFVIKSSQLNSLRSKDQPLPLCTSLKRFPSKVLACLVSPTPKTLNGQPRAPPLRVEGRDQREDEIGKPTSHLLGAGDFGALCESMYRTALGSMVLAGWGPGPRVTHALLYRPHF